MWLESQSTAVAKKNKKKKQWLPTLLYWSPPTWHAILAVLLKSTTTCSKYVFNTSQRARWSVFRNARMASAQWDVARNAADGARTHSISLRLGTNPETLKIPSCFGQQRATDSESRGRILLSKHFMMLCNDPQRVLKVKVLGSCKSNIWEADPMREMWQRLSFNWAFCITLGSTS